MSKVSVSQRSASAALKRSTKSSRLTGRSPRETRSSTAISTTVRELSRRARIQVRRGLIVNDNMRPRMPMETPERHLQQRRRTELELHELLQPDKLQRAAVRKVGDLPGRQAQPQRLARLVRRLGQFFLVEDEHRLRCADRKVDCATRVGTCGLLRGGNGVPTKLRDTRRHRGQVMVEPGEAAPR